MAATATAEGADGDALLAALHTVASEGSDRGRIIDRALALTGADGIDVRPLVEAFLPHRPASLPRWPGTREALAGLRRHVPIGLVSDGDPGVQRGKLRALGLDGAFDVVVLSDLLGRGRRKPHPAPFLRALDLLSAPATRAIYVGDRPDKDVAGAAAVGMRALRVRTGEYRVHQPERDLVERQLGEG